jgi:hypothetical protein
VSLYGDCVQSLSSEVRRVGAVAEGPPSPSAGGAGGVYYVEFGEGQVAKVDVTFLSGQPPTGTFEDPSTRLAADKGGVRRQPH